MGTPIQLDAAAEDWAAVRTHAEAALQVALLVPMWRAGHLIASRAPGSRGHHVAGAVARLTEAPVPTGRAAWGARWGSLRPLQILTAQYRATSGPSQGGYAVTGTCGNRSGCVAQAQVTAEGGGAAVLDGWGPAPVDIATGLGNLSSSLNATTTAGGAPTVAAAGSAAFRARPAARGVPADAGVVPPDTPAG